MPELPEVETVRRGLMRTLAGHRITRAQTRRPNLRYDFPVNLAERLKDRTVTTLSRRSKYLLIHLDSDEILLIHLGMSGRILFDTMPDYKPAKHDHFLLYLDNDQVMIFSDPRRFGLVDLIAAKEQHSHKYFKDLGPEPLSDAFNGETLFKMSRNRKTPIKNFIMDARRVVGVGNIYACESLFEAGIHPQKQAGNLSKKQCDALANAIKSVLERAIAAGGSSLRDYVATDGTLGRFQLTMKVYGREEELCRKENCGGTVQRIVQQGRSTFYCSTCQKKA